MLIGVLTFGSGGVDVNTTQPNIQSPVTGENKAP
jgi:hypothetical protein